MVLAAGKAVRLRPLTDDRAKAVVPFLNRPLLDYTLDWLRRCGFREVWVNLHHQPDSIAGTYGGRAFQMTIRYSVEERLLGTAGGPRRILEQLRPTTLLINGDTVSSLALGPLLRQHRSGALATLALYRGESSRGYPTVTANGAGHLLAFPGDPMPTVERPVQGVFSGVHLVEREVLETLPAGEPVGMVDPVYRALLRAGLPVHALPVAGSWYEAGDPSRYIDAQLAALEQGHASLGYARARRLLSGGYVSRDTHLENVRLEPPFLIGAGTRLKHGSILRGLVVADVCRVENGCRITESVLWKGSNVGPGCRLHRVVVMEGVAVPSRTEGQEVVFTKEGPVPFATAPLAGPT